MTDLELRHCIIIAEQTLTKPAHSTSLEILLSKALLELKGRVLKLTDNYEKLQKTI